MSRTLIMSFAVMVAVVIPDGRTVTWAQAQLGQPQSIQSGAGANATSKSAGANRSGINPQTANFNGYSQAPWFSNPAIRQQLRWNDNQYNQINNNYQKAWTDYSSGLSRLGSNLSADQRLEQQRQLQNQFERDWTQNLNNTLADQSAQQQYRQMHLQYQGYGAFQYPVVQNKLGLTADQQKAFSQYQNGWDKQMNTWQSQYADNPDTVAAQFQRSRQQFQDRVNSTLTPQQRSEWTNLVGKPYNLPPEVYFANQPETTTTLKPPNR